MVHQFRPKHCFPGARRNGQYAWLLREISVHSLPGPNRPRRPDQPGSFHPFARDERAPDLVHEFIFRRRLFHQPNSTSGLFDHRQISGHGFGCQTPHSDSDIHPLKRQPRGFRRANRPASLEIQVPGNGRVQPRRFSPLSRPDSRGRIQYHRQRVRQLRAEFADHESDRANSHARFEAKQTLHLSSRDHSSGQHQCRSAEHIHRRGRKLQFRRLCF